MNDADIEHLVMPKIERRILLLCDTWSSTRDGITAVNQSLAQNLARYKGTRIFSTVLGSSDTSASDKQDNVELIHSIAGTKRGLFSQLDSDPGAVFTDIATKAPKVSFIVGHAPITAKAALHLRDTVYPKAKVILFYHVIPGDVEWIGESLPYPMPDDNALVQMAEKADVVYSVTDKCHWYFTAKFRNRAKHPIDHRKFYPQCSEKVFNNIKRKVPSDVESKPAKIIALCDGGDPEVWLGIDIAVTAVSKIASQLRSHGKDLDSLKILNLSSSSLDAVNKKIKEYPNPNNIRIEACSVDKMEALYRDLEECSLCLIPSRAEPFGAVGMAALSAGIPTLVAQDSAIASIIARLTSEPEFFTVPVTQSPVAYRQDGSTWRDGALAMLLDPLTAQERALQLSMALRRDEFTKQTHDNVVSYCLGGIQVLHDATNLEMQMEGDKEKELLKQREFNQFLTAVMKQCWRLKHHPLTQHTDLFQLLSGVSLPIQELVSEVTNAIEDRDRRIVGVDETTGAFVVYCPSPTALQDLWSRCDVINGVLEKILFRGNQPNPVCRAFGLEFAKIRTSIKGPEYLAYKKELMRNLVA